MRRFLVIATALALICGFAIPTAQAAPPSLSCSNPQKLTSTEGTLHFPGNLTVQQDEWSPRKGETQSMLVCSPSSWQATVSVGGQPEDGVTTYPDSGTTYPDNCGQTHKLSEFAAITSTYATTPPTDPASWDYAYDLFLGGGICKEHFTEVMVWDKWNDVSVPKAQLHAIIDGDAYDIFHSDGYIQVRRVNQNTSGTVNLGHVLAYLYIEGLITNVHLIFTQDGYEVLTTFGAPVTFPLTDFSINEPLK